MADRYWVGGTANWDGTAGTKWATTSGGVGGASVPTSADNVFFDANSGAGTVTVPFTTVSCANLNFTGFTGTFAGSGSTVGIFNSLTVATGMTWSYSGDLGFYATTAGNTITTNGKTLTCGVGFLATGAWALQDALTITGTFSFTTSGTLTTNNHNINCKRFTLNYGTFAAGSSTITVDGNSSFDAGQILIVGSIFSPLTVTGTSTIKVQNIGPLTVAFFGAVTLYNLEVYGGSAIIDTSTAGGSLTFNNLKIAPTSTSSALILYYNITVNGTFTSTGTSVQDRNIVRSDLRGIQRAITAAAVSIQDTDFRDINANGAAVPWALSTQRVGDLGNNSDITFPAAVNRYAVANGNWSSTAVWSATSGGATGASVPLPQDTAIFDANTGAGTYTFNVTRIGGVDASALGARVITLGTSIDVYKSFSLSAACVFTPGANSVTFAGNGANTITSNTKQFNAVNIFGNYKLLSDLFCGSMNISGSLFEANGYNLSAASFLIARFSVISPTVTVYMGSGTWTATGTSGWVINTASVTLFPETSTIDIAASATTTYTFDGGGATYNNLRISGSTGASIVSLTGNNTFTSITSTKTNAYTLRFPASGTTTVGSWSVNGSSGNIITIDSSSAGTRANLTKTGGGLVVSNFVSVKDINASPASTFYAVNSTNAGNNVNWTFNFPASQGNLLAFFT